MEYVLKLKKNLFRETDYVPHYVWYVTFVKMNKIRYFISYNQIPASYTMGTRGSFPRGKAQLGHDADHPLPSSTEVKEE
jgi:hypothetical protein